MSKSQDLMISIFGKKSSGKTNLIKLQLSGVQSFTYTEPKNNTEIQRGHKTRIQLSTMKNDWVTSYMVEVTDGESKLTQNCLKKTEGIIIVFDVNDSDSVKYIKDIAQKFSKNKKSVPTILVGNINSDTEREITNEKCQEISKTFFGKELHYYEIDLETSKSNKVDSIFVDLAKQIMVNKIQTGNKRRSSGFLQSVPDSDLSDLK
eukprot:gene1602-12727_t